MSSRLLFAFPHQTGSSAKAVSVPTSPEGLENRPYLSILSCWNQGKTNKETNKKNPI